MSSRADADDVQMLLPGRCSRVDVKASHRRGGAAKMHLSEPRSASLQGAALDWPVVFCPAKLGRPVLGEQASEREIKRRRSQPHPGGVGLCSPPLPPSRLCADTGPYGTDLTRPDQTRTKVPKYRVPQRFSARNRACCPLVAASAPDADLKPQSAHARRSTSVARTYLSSDLSIRAKLDPRWPGLGDGLNPQSSSAPRDASLRLCCPMPSSSSLASLAYPSFPSEDSQLIDPPAHRCAAETWKSRPTGTLCLERLKHLRPPHPNSSRNLLDSTANPLCSWCRCRYHDHYRPSCPPPEG